MEQPSFLGDPADTREAIMKATYYALCEHGYADLTIQRIGDHFEKSKSLLYHHYDGKDELLLDFLEFMLEELQRTVPGEDDGGDASDCLEAFLAIVFAEEIPEEVRQFVKAIIELRAQAAHDERYREHFTRHDQFFEERLADIVEAGIEEGVFREVDPDRVAAFLRNVAGGEMMKRATSNDVSTAIRDELDAYIETRLLADGAGE